MMEGKFRLVSKPPRGHRFSGKSLGFAKMLRYLRQEVWDSADAAAVLKLLDQAERCQEWDLIDTELTACLPDPDGRTVYERLTEYHELWEAISKRRSFPLPNRLTWVEVERLLLALPHPVDLFGFIQRQVDTWDEAKVIAIYQKIDQALLLRVKQITVAKPPPKTRKAYGAWRQRTIDKHPDVIALRESLHFLETQVDNLPWLAQIRRKTG
jgi:hypothetical protein